MTGPKELTRNKPNTELQERKCQSEIDGYQIIKKSRVNTAHKSDYKNSNMKVDYRSFNDKNLIEQINFDIVKVFVCYEAPEGKFDIAMADNKQLAEALEKVKRSFSSLEVALDKAEDEVMKGTTKQIKRGRN
ncbi:hypothetical protein WN944_010962 [Citrus x changshan-huyou]|uniref:Uncharacterized protein n=1 Tax=Citrus x changshan-huyou TaxID=2935761 RepID=A0AAP0MSM8_9ROSI